MRVMFPRSASVLALVVAAAPCAAQAPPEDAEVTEVAWLAGCWAAGAGPTVSEEVWMRPEGGMMVGMARSVREGVVRGWEFLLLRHLEGGLTYSAHPSGQQLTHFRASAVGPDRVVFTNPEHDFPKALEYLRAGADSLHARVYGELRDGGVDGVDPAFVLRYGRRDGC